jgi:hypothetical protein
MTVSNVEFVDTAVKLAADANNEGIKLRILGSLAFRLHCPENLELFDKMQRDLTDVDFAATSDQRKKIQAYLEGLGYQMDRDIQAATEGARWFFTHPVTGLGVDVFFNELYFCHKIPFAGRLDLDSPTIPLADLTLEKMQIVEINPKDIKDALVLLLEHPIGSGDREAIDGNYIAKLLSSDWGFYYTVTTNLGKLRTLGLEYGALDKSEWDIVRERIEQLEKLIEDEPKTRGWKLRARIGTRKQWYQEVAEKSATFS